MHSLVPLADGCCCLGHFHSRLLCLGPVVLPCQHLQFSASASHLHPIPVHPPAWSVHGLQAHPLILRVTLMGVFPLLLSLLAQTVGGCDGGCKSTCLLSSASPLFQLLLMHCHQPNSPVHGKRQLFTALYNFSC